MNICKVYNVPILHPVLQKAFQYSLEGHIMFQYYQNMRNECVHLLKDTCLLRKLLGVFSLYF